MSEFQCDLLSVRLLRLAPGSEIKEHLDHSLSLDDAELRLHVPVQTNPDISFWLNNKVIPLRAGETWYQNDNQPHRVENNSDEFRVHMVFDSEINTWLRQQVDIAA
jgi:aspartyl/asparaginyl beta-hydroxylase (cupin superfamily)